MGQRRENSDRDGSASSSSGLKTNLRCSPGPNPAAGRAPSRPFTSRMAGFGSLLADSIGSVLLAPSCASCDLPLEQPSLGAICPGCWAAVRVLSPPLCDMCGGPLPGGFDCLCNRCRTSPRLVSRLRAVGPYEGRLREILHALKYQGRRSIAVVLAAMMQSAGRSLLEEADVVVPVPLHWRRTWSRGFNQADDLAVHLGLPVRRILRRRRFTLPQVSLPGIERWENVRGAFMLSRRSRKKKRTVLAGLTAVLVDDVTTTGATLEACAVALEQAGARRVWAITAARAAPPRSS